MCQSHAAYGGEISGTMRNLWVGGGSCVRPDPINLDTEACIAYTVPNEVASAAVGFVDPLLSKGAARRSDARTGRSTILPPIPDASCACPVAQGCRVRQLKRQPLQSERLEWNHQTRSNPADGRKRVPWAGLGSDQCTATDGLEPCLPLPSLN